MRRSIIHFLCLFVAVTVFSAFLTSETSALELTSNVTLVTGSFRSVIDYYPVSGFGQNCSKTGSYLIGGGGNETPCYLSSVSLTTQDRSYSVGDFIVQELYVHNTQVNNSSDVMARINSYTIATTGNAGADLVDVKFDSVDDSSGKITFTSRVWRAGNIYNIGYGFEQYAAFGLFSSEWLASGYTTVWHENNNVDYSTSIGNISSAIANQGQALQNIVDNTYYTHQDTASINTRVGTINGNVADIKSLLQNELGGMTQAIDDQTQAMNDIHDDEVDRIEGGVSDGQAEVENMDTTLNPVNPITWLFSGLEVHQCYDISQLAGFLHAPSSTYCSWFSDTTRNIVSPVINLFATIVIIGFAYSWLKKGGL